MENGYFLMQIKANFFGQKCFMLVAYLQVLVKERRHEIGLETFFLFVQC